MANEAYVNNVVVEEHPHAVTFDNADVVTAAQPAAAMNHNRYQVVHPIRVARIVRLQTPAHVNMNLLTEYLKNKNPFNGFLSRTTWVSWYHKTDRHTFNGPFSGTTQVSRYQKGKTNLDFTEARDSEWQ